MSSAKVPLAFACVVVLLLAASSVVAGAPPTPGDTAGTVPYAGQLNDETGAAVPDGPYDFVFRLYDAPEGGNLLWSETQAGVPTVGGAFATALGKAVPLPKEVLEAKQIWLAVSVRAAGQEAFAELAPRQAVEPSGGNAVTALTCPHSHFTDTWSGSTSLGYGLLVDQEGTGDGVRAVSNATASNYAAVYAVNIAASGSGRGVYGYSSSGTGGYFESSKNDGLEVISTAPAANSKSAVYAHAVDANGVWSVSTNRQGVHGESANDFGVAATGGGDASWSDLKGDLVLGGNRAEAFAFGDILEIYGNGWIALELDNDNNADRDFEIWNGADVLVFRVYENGNMVAAGTKSAVVNTADYGQRLLYAVESPEVWFEDIGSAVLTDGRAAVAFDPIFVQTANLQVAYKVFLTPVCEDPIVLTVASKTATGFSVKGVTLREQPSNCAFDYRVVAKRLGYEGVRLERGDGQPNSHSAGVNP